MNKKALIATFGATAPMNVMKYGFKVVTLAMGLMLPGCGRGPADMESAFWLALLPRPSEVNYLALGSNSAVSSDGAAWEPELSSPLSVARSVACGNGRVVATKGADLSGAPADENQTAVSADAKNWETNQRHRPNPDVPGSDPNFTGPSNSVAFGKGAFVLTAPGSFYRSEDGRRWTGAVGPFSSGPIAFGNGKFVTQANCENGCQHYWSANGDSWTAYSIPSGVRASGLAFGDGNFVVVGREATGPISTEFRALYSPDGITWTAAVLVPANFGVSANAEIGVVFGNSRFIATVNQTAQFYSDDAGLTWHSLPSNPFDPSNVATIQFSDIAFGKGEFMAVGYSDSFDSPDPEARWGCPREDGRTIQPGIAGDRCRNIYTSKDGVSWLKVFDGLASRTKVNLNVVRYVGNCF